MMPDRPTSRWPSRPELRWAAGFAAVVMALTCLPYLYGLLIKPSDAYYSGLIANPDEHNVYLAYMKESAEGSAFLIDPFTSEPQRGRVINLFFLVLGRSAAIKHIALALEYHLARVISGWLLLMAIYCLAAQAVESVWARRLALWLAALGSGFGWLYHAGPGQPNPIDYGIGLVMPEVITFLSLLLNPLFCFSVFLMIVAIGLGAHALGAQAETCAPHSRLRSAVLAGIAALILGNIHTYDVIPVAVVLAGYLVLLIVTRRARATTLAMALAIAVIASPSLIYQWWLLRSGEVTLAIKTAETPVHSPQFIFLALGLGLPLVLAIPGLWRAIRGGSDGARLLALWLVLGLALIYVPVPFQRKLAEGVQIPVVIVAVVGIEPLFAKLSRTRTALAALLVLLALPSNLLFLSRAKSDLETNNAAYVANLMPPLYLREDQYRALQWLDAHASFKDMLLCNSFLGSYAPSLAGTRVYVGHWAETLHYPAKLRGFADFLRDSTPDASRQAFIRKEGISYVLRDRSIYDELFLSTQGAPVPAFDPDRAPWLERVWPGPGEPQSAVSLYRVR